MCILKSIRVHVCGKQNKSGNRRKMSTIKCTLILKAKNTARHKHFDICNVCFKHYHLQVEPNPKKIVQ